MIMNKLFHTSMALFGCFILVAGNCFSQDFHFSQFWMTPLLQNPALSGSGQQLQAIVNHKTQWGSITSPYKTNNLSCDMYLNKEKNKKGFWAGGINVLSDKAGDGNMATTTGNLAIAYHVHVDARHTIGGGLTGGFVQRSIDYSTLQWMNQYNGINYNPSLSTGEPNGSKSVIFGDCGAGILWSFSKAEKYITGNDQIKAKIGLALFHPQQSNYSFYKFSEKLYMKKVIHASLLYGIKNTKYALVPKLLYYRQGPAQELFFGSLIRYTIHEASKYTGIIKESSVSMGMYFRNRDAVVPTVLLEFSQYTIGFSYDVNISRLRTASSYRGGFEISLCFIHSD